MTRHSRASPPRKMGVVLVRMASWLHVSHHHPENVMAPLALGQAWSLLDRAGFQPRLLDTELGGFDEDALVRAITEVAPRLVVLYGITPSVPLMLRVIARLREALPDAFLLAAGQHATVEPGSLLGPGAFHAAALREPEETIFDLACRIDQAGDPADVAGLVLPGQPVQYTADRPLQTDLDSLPFPHHPLFRRSGYRVYHPVGRVRRMRWGFLIGGRGCPYPCSYCSGTLRNSYGRTHRTRSPASVVQEVRWLAELGFTVLHFADDVFSFDRDHTLALCDRLSHLRPRLPFTVQTRVDHVDLPILQAMKRAGCTTVSFGVESGSSAILDRLHKHTSVDQARVAFRLAREAGLLRVGFFLLGSPGETIEDMRSTLALARELDPDIVQVAFLTPYPGSTIWDELPVSERPTYEWLSHYNRAWNPSAVSDQDLVAFQRRFYREMVLRPRFLARYAWIRRHELVWNLDKELVFAREALRFLSRQGR